MNNCEGLLVVLSGPSGAGKDTVLTRLVAQHANARVSVSATTRSPRPGEVYGEDYYFLSKAEFIQMISQNNMLEYAEYCDHYYGTPRGPVEEWMHKGKDVILEIEVQGGAQIKKAFPESVSIFILPPSLSILEQRLRKRHTEEEAVLKQRLDVAKQEMQKAFEYDYVVINDGSTDDTRKICARRGYNFMDLPVNTGLSGAVKSGMRYANYYGYDYVLQLDGDGQHDPAYIADMIDEMERTGCDIVIGSRFKTERKPINSRMIGSQIITTAIWLTTGGKYIGDVTSGMRLFNKKMIKHFGYNMHYSPEPDTLAYLLNCGVDIREVQVHMSERIAGVSYLNFKNSVWYMMKMLFSILLFQWVRKR